MRTYCNVTQGMTSQINDFNLNWTEDHAKTLREILTEFFHLSFVRH